MIILRCSENLVIRVSLGLLYISVAVLHGFDFVFSVLVNRLARKTISARNYQFCVYWDVKP